jgi:hypothetical protein
LRIDKAPRTEWRTDCHHLDEPLGNQVEQFLGVHFAVGDLALFVSLRGATIFLLLFVGRSIAAGAAFRRLDWLKASPQAGLPAPLNRDAAPGRFRPFLAAAERRSHFILNSISFLINHLATGMSRIRTARVVAFDRERNASRKKD